MTDSLKRIVEALNEYKKDPKRNHERIKMISRILYQKKDVLSKKMIKFLSQGGFGEYDYAEVEDLNGDIVSALVNKDASYYQTFIGKEYIDDIGGYLTDKRSSKYDDGLLVLGVSEDPDDDVDLRTFIEKIDNEESIYSTDFRNYVKMSTNYIIASDMEKELNVSKKTKPKYTNIKHQFDEGFEI